MTPGALATVDEWRPTLDGYTLELVDPLEADPERGWIDLSTLATDREVLDELLRRAAVAAGTPLRAVTATWIVEKATWFLAAGAFTQLLQHGRCAGFGEASLLHRESGWAEAVALPSHEHDPFGPGDLAPRLESALEPLVARLASCRAPRALWLSVGDRVAQAATWTGAALDRSADAVEIASAALAAPTSLRAPARFSWDDGVPSRRRVGCCLSYRCADGVRCVDCPVATT